MTLEKMDSQFSVEVRSRICRASYGIICQEKWDENKHLPEDKFWDDDQQGFKARNQMKWLVKEVCEPCLPWEWTFATALMLMDDYEQGEDVMVEKKFRHYFFKILEGQPENLFTTIWMTKTSPPPSRKDESVFKHCEVKWATKIDTGRLPVFINNQGKSFSQLDFAAEMKCGGGSTEFAIFHNGRRQATKNVTVEFHDHTSI